MTQPLATPRKLFMHSAHRTVGVLGACASFGPCFSTEDLLPDDVPPPTLESQEPTVDQEPGDGENPLE